ncbi:MAG: RT0821/Lpp0805 family surface protein [Hyphomicrobiaceae bacterium]
MQKTRFVAPVVIAALLLTGCASDTPKQDTGMVVGAIAGGVLGNAAGRGRGRPAAAILGAVLGGIVGSEIGRSMDKQDRILAQQAELAAFERGRSGEPVPWRNPDNGRYGEVVPGASYRRGPQDCRDYTHTIFIDGRSQVMRGTACREPDGTWRAVA